MKLNPTIKHSVLGASLVLALCASSQAAMLLAVDFNDVRGTPTVTSPTETGFQAFDRDTATEDTTVGNATQTYATLGGNITVRFEFLFGQGLAQLGVPRDRGLNNLGDNGTFTQGDLLRDLFTNVNETTNGTTIYLSGLAANTPYQIKLFSYDNSNANSLFAYYDTTATTGVGGTKTGTGTGTLLGQFNNQSGAGTYPNDNNDFSLTATVTSSATGFISLGHTSSLSGGAVNGFELTAVPEPSSAMAFVSGLAFLIVRRRRSATI